ncbi:MAG: hypothetical protein Q4C47_04850 [Planctomycetia bacterium]|nr:hypothetical protein [Planctomycetia bacterium]
MEPFGYFDRSQLKLLPLSERVHDIRREEIMIDPGNLPSQPFTHESIPAIATAMREARERESAILMACGAHVLRRGNGPLLIDLMRRGLLTNLALNGAGSIHDFELAMIGATCESVARYVSEGQFGLWKETSYYNNAVTAGAKDGLGVGESLGRWIVEHDFPYAETSVLAQAWKQRCESSHPEIAPKVTVHIAFGQDIVHGHPGFDPAATGVATYRDFLAFTRNVEKLEGGVFLNIGTAVMGPEVYLKALAMARNVAHQKRPAQEIRHFTTAVFDVADLGDDIHTTASKNDPRYYFRPFKTVLVRTVADGGKSYYVRGDHRQTVPALYAALQ